MTDRLAEVEARVAGVAERLHALEQRIAALEAGPASVGQPRARPRGARGGAAPAAAPSAAALVGSVTFVGRTLLVLAGAFVLRALTDAGTLPGWLGVTLGLAYAGAWVALADRAGKAGATASAVFHGVAAVLVGFPLLLEATSRFRLLPPAAAAALLAALTAVALGVAARRRLEPLAWAVTLGGIAVAVAMAAATGRIAPFAAYLVLLGVATLWMSYVLDWFSLRAPPAIAADLVVAALAFGAGRARGEEGPLAAFAVLTLLMALYLGTVATRTLLMRRDVLAFEVAQGAAAIAVGLGGAAFVAARTGGSATGVGAAATALGLAAYAVAFAFLERPAQRRRNFRFYATVAVLLVLAGTSLLLSGGALSLAWTALALAAGALGRRLGRLTLAAHAMAYAVAAAIASGLVAHTLEASFASARTPWSPVAPAALAALAALCLVAWLGADERTRGRPERAARAALLALAAAGGAGVAIGWVAPAAAGVPGSGADAGMLAASRTALLVATALALAALGRRPAWFEAASLAYPALAAIGLKLLFEDLPRGRAATLLVAFACYGAALILVPRLRRRAAAAAPPARSAA